MNGEMPLLLLLHRIQKMTSKTDIEQAILDEHARRFTQASDTPFLLEPLYSLIGPLGVSEACDQILQGTFAPPPGTDPYSARLIQALRSCDSVPSNTRWSVSFDEYCQFGKRRRETTSSSISGVHFGHYKAATTELVLASVNQRLLSFCFETGYASSRHCRALDLAIEKKPRNFRVEKLRAIILFEASFNAGNKLFGRQMMATAEELSLLAQEQAGSRRGRAERHVAPL